MRGIKALACAGLACLTLLSAASSQAYLSIAQDSTVPPQPEQAAFGAALEPQDVCEDAPVLVVPEATLETPAQALYADDEPLPARGARSQRSADAPEFTTIEQDTTSAFAASIHERLMELGYMSFDEPTEYFSEAIYQAMVLFLNQNDYPENPAVISPDAYGLLMSDRAQPYIVGRGASGVDVEELQSRLVELGYLDEANGVFDEAMEDALRDFQRSNDLTDHGKIDSATREMLYSEAAVANAIEFGDRSDEIRGYQERLKALGYLTTSPDGVYGNDTVAALKRFQEINGLIADGFFGPRTIALLTGDEAKANKLMLGMSGDDVYRVQTLLKRLGYTSQVTGHFGSVTQSAVKAFQANNSLAVDGSVGKQTMTALTSPNARRAPQRQAPAAQQQPSATQAAPPAAQPSVPAAVSGDVEGFLSVAMSKLGHKYVLGGKGPNTFDCSGFVYYCLNQAGVSQAYMTAATWAKSGKYQRITSIGALQRGDILVFNGHMGIYLGGGGMIDASSSKGQVITRGDIWSLPYWNNNFICGFRVY